MDIVDFSIALLVLFLLYKAQEWLISYRNRAEEPGDSDELPTREEVTKYRIVIAIDFGTTYSGCTLGFPGNGTIKYIEKWPDQISTYSKIPTAIIYDASGNVQHWGQTAETMKLRNKIPDSWLYCCLFKLCLDETYPMREYMKMPYGKEPLDVISDYLREMHEYVLTQVKLKHDYTRDQMRYTLTIPASWSTDAKRFMRSAAISAGLIGAYDPSERLILVREPEAALISCLRTYPAIETSKTVMICDAGGGTVDMCTFAIGKNSDGTQNLREISLGKGRTIGSAMLDKAFETYLRETKIGPTLCNMLDSRDIPRMVEEFTMSVKTIFKQGKKEYRIESPLHRDPKLLERLPSGTVVDDTHLILSFEELQEYIFDPIVSQVINLIYHQVECLRKKGLSNPVCGKLLLVGGFGDNEYLYQRVKECFQTTGTIRSVEKAANPSMAVVQGAAYSGIEPKLVSTRVSRFSYGVCTMPKFIRGVHSQSKKVIGGDGIERCESVYKELVKQGEELELDNTRHTMFKTINKDRRPEVKIYAYDGLDSPRYVDDPGVFLVGTIEVPQLSHVKRVVNSKRPLEINLYIYFGHSEVKAMVEIENKRFNVTIEGMHS